MSSLTAASKTRQTSDRRGNNSEENSGLNPRRIQTGVPGLRRTVYDGALRVSNDAYAILTTCVADVVASAASSSAANDVSNNNGGASGVGGVTNLNLQAKPEWRTHFPLNALIRPSCDDMYHDEFNIPVAATSSTTTSSAATSSTAGGNISAATAGARTAKKRRVLKVTKLHNEKVTVTIPKIINEQTGERTMVSMDTIQTVARDLLVNVLDAPHHEEEESVEGEVGVGGELKGGVEGGNPNGGEEVLSLRGGGEGDGGEDVTMDDGGVVGDNNEGEATVVPGAAGVGVGEGNAGGNNQQDDVDMAEAANSASAVGGGDGGTTAAAAATVGGEAEGGGSSGGGVVGAVAVAESNNVVVENNNTAGEVQMEAVAAPAVTTTTETNPVAAAPPAAATVTTAVTTTEQVPATTVNSDEKVQEVSSSGVQQQQGGGVADVPSSSTPQVVATAPAPTAAESAPTTATTTEATPSSSTASEAAAAPEATTVKSTDIHPLPTVHPPLSTSLPTSTTATTSEDDPNPANIYRPSWYDIKTISNIEKSSLPEWFNSSAPHRTPTSYLSTRNQILTIYSKQASLALATAHQGGGGQHYLTVSAIRRIVPGDVGSLTRLHTFLCDSGMMNVGHVGENAPSDLALRGGSSGKGKRSFEEVQRSTFWSKERLEELDGLVVKYAKSSGSSEAPVSVEGAPQPPPQPPQASVDWEAVANEIGEGLSAADCQRAFLDPPKVDNVSVKIAKTSGGFDLSTILDGVHPDVLNATINASLKATNDVVEARKASIAGIIASTAVMKGQSEEEEIAQTLMDILDQRMQRLENRVAILDDVEALLEAERVALELERRDMYTTRCRHWFGDGSS